METWFNSVHVYVHVRVSFRHSVITPGVFDTKVNEMVRVSRKNLKKKNVSRNLHRFIHRTNRTLDVPVSYVSTPVRTRVARRWSVARKHWPVLYLSDWFKTCMNHGEFQGFFMLGGYKLHQLSDVEEMLETFWKNHAYINDHQPAVPRRTIPMYLHGDEGRGQGKRPLLVIGFQPIVGWAGVEHVNSSKYLGQCVGFQCMHCILSHVLPYASFSSKAYIHHPLFVHPSAFGKLCWRLLRTITTMLDEGTC